VTQKVNPVELKLNELKINELKAIWKTLLKDKKEKENFLSSVSFFVI
jgi:hypothetical protein